MVDSGPVAKATNPKLTPSINQQAQLNYSSLNHIMITVEVLKETEVLFAQQYYDNINQYYDNIHHSWRCK